MHRWLHTNAMTYGNFPEMKLLKTAPFLAVKLSVKKWPSVKIRSALISRLESGHSILSGTEKVYNRFSISKTQQPSAVNHVANTIPEQIGGENVLCIRS